MTIGKRLFDVVLALILSILLGGVIIGLALVILIKEGRPVFYLSERMKTPTHGFRLIKFRTMKVVAHDSGVSGGDKINRVTPFGRFLRRARLDELPQLWNVLRGDISFVGPRPPLREYVERFPQIYAQVLITRPGITGLASVRYHAHEEMLLARCTTAKQTDEIYARACVPRKARLDLIYQAHQSRCFDLRIMIETIWPKLRKF
ncbi:sugar transferase [Pacificibacter marinus]|uniref:sugar transferase n=1 Tax=Pacificibacter marinus TaxID=658057 RepID=UPI001C07931F|nr:sugar transferase [Pacificibacter marinus]MBU2866112.1 sugar transferase [Pacificibacter marinus]